MKKIEEKKKNDSSNGKSFSLTFLLGWLYGLFGVALGFNNKNLFYKLRCCWSLCCFKNFK